MKSQKTLAIVGIGPRGSHALENLVKKLVQHRTIENIHLLLFEASADLGNGPVYSLKQPETNWININERILYLEKREELDFGGVSIPEFPSYHDWIGKDYTTISSDEPDTYPPRKQVGAYLHQRFLSLFTPLKNAAIVTLINEAVQDVKYEDRFVELITNQGNIYKADQVLLTIGHQSTRESTQIKKWQAYAAENANATLFTHPYPISRLINHDKLKHTSTIGIRGFGLATIDVVRGIAEKYGRFELINSESRSVRYISEKSIADLLIPFSLDGLPMSPKPLNARIDKWYKPAQKRIEEFSRIIGDKNNQRKASGISLLVNAISPIAAEIYFSLVRATPYHFHNKNDLETLICNWLSDEGFDHPLLTSRKQPPLKTMKQFAGMATGTADVSLDYCVTQVWRHCQPTIYQQLSFNECDDQVFGEIIKLDERLKRYTYGPPVESIQQLIALTEAGVMNLETVNNPDIELSEKGWVLKMNGKSHTAGIMINAVLDPPKLKAVDSPIIENFLKNDLIHPVHDDFGVLVDDNGYVLSEEGEQFLPIAVLGRLVKGTVIGVDAILECFGVRSELWANEAAKRLR